jgi:pilus assembly protein FimV
VETRRKIVLVFLLGVAFNAAALTLGRVRGVALVGQPLDVTIQAQISGDETPGSLCAEADVFHADARQEPSRVRVTVEGASPQTANIRVTSSTPVDEPVVTIYLKAGCSQKITRRYVMLADVPTEPAPLAAPSLPVVVAPAASAPAAASAPGAADTGGNVSAAATAPAVAGTAPAQVSNPVRERPAAPAKPRPAVVKKPAPKPLAMAKPAPAPAVVKKEEVVVVPKTPASSAPAQPKLEEKPAPVAESGQSRLKLDPMLSLAERVTTLEATAAAPTPEAARDAQRVQTLEESVKTLVALAAKNEASMLEMRNRLQRAEGERGVPMAWLYGLAALSLACLAGLAYVLMRQRAIQARPERDDWWSASKSAPTSVAHNRDAVTTPPSGLGALRDDEMSTVAVNPKIRAPAAAMAQDNPESEMDVSLVEMSESNFDTLMRSGQAHGALRKGPLPAATDMASTRVQPMEIARSINSEQIFDIRQQAAFFVSLGQTDQAVRILENSINESGESSPLLYLDLLDIFHNLGLKQDYHQFREDFNLLFNSRVPEFSDYRNEGRSLEEYPHVLAHVTALWSTVKAQMVIEASIFRDPLDDKSKPFDLAAFRDLLLLHAIAQSNTRGDSGISGLAPLSTVPVNLQPPGQRSPVADLGVDIALDVESSKMPPMPPPGANLDLDLSDLVGSEPKPVVSQKSDEETEFPSLMTGPSPLPPLKREPKPGQVVQDNHYLDFDKNPTMRYTLPKSKE